jgi:putative membrane protein
MHKNLSLGFAGLTVLAQIIWPLTHDQERVFVTQVSVLCFVIASLLHASHRIGLLKALGTFGVTASVALAVEYIGVHTGILFGDYEYTEVLQPQIAAVPLTVLGAWFMMLWPACVAANIVLSDLPRFAQAAFAGFMMMSWDFFLDTQMVSEGYWVWATPNQTLIGMPGIPWTNYLSWFVVGFGLAFAVLHFVRDSAIDRNVTGPAVLLLWTWVGGFIAHTFFWNNLGTALWGTVALGVCCIPFIRAILKRPETIRS